MGGDSPRFGVEACAGGFGRRAKRPVALSAPADAGGGVGPEWRGASGRAQPAACVVAAEDERLRRGSVPVTGADQAFRG
jgi:hypothetical protein